MERAIIYCAKTGLEATDHFVPELLEKYCKDNGYEIVAMLSEPASTEGVSFPMKYAFIGLNMEEDVNTIITLSKDMIGATDETVIDTLGKLSEYDIYVEDINGELEECYEMMYKEHVQGEFQVVAGIKPAAGHIVVGHAVRTPRNLVPVRLHAALLHLVKKHRLLQSLTIIIGRGC